VIGKSAGKSFAYLLGVYLGDGCITDQNSYGRFWRKVFRLNTIDADFAEATKAAFQSLDRPCWLNINTHAVKKSSNPNHSLTANPGQDVLGAMIEITDAKRRLPPDIFDAPLDERLAFIAGLMDSEGFVAANKNPTNRRYYMGFKSCDEWVPEFVRLLEVTGIRVGKVQTEQPYKPGYKAPTRFTIKMQSWIDAGAYFNIQRKQQRVEEWASAPPLANKAKWGEAKKRRLTSETNMRNVA